MSIRLVSLVLLTALPGLAGAERIVTRDGEVFVGEPRFEGTEVVIRRADGSEVRLPRTEVERIDLDDASARTEPEAPRGIPREQPTYPTYVPPPPPPPPDPSVGRRIGEKRGFRSGLLLATGYHRGMAVAGEWQQRLAPALALGLGLQGGLAFNSEVACPTWGATGRFYAGLRHRLALEAGYGINRIDPYVEDRLRRIDRDPRCGDAEINRSPEFSAGYQYVSPTGFAFDTLLGVALLTNDAISDAEDADVAPIFQIRLGYVFR